jgi:hypothetical protein
MGSSVKRLIVLILALLIIFPSVSSAKKKQANAKRGATSFANCPNEGCGGEVELNKKKDKTSKSASADVQTFTRSDFVRFKFPASWTSGTKRKLLDTWGEGTPVELETYIIKTKHYPGGAESCNCNLKDEANNDFHLVTGSFCCLLRVFSRCDATHPC